MIKLINCTQGIVTKMTMLAIAMLFGCAPMSEVIRDEAAGMNGSFEITKSGLPVNWLLYTPKIVKNSDFDLIIDSSEYKDGIQSLKFLVREYAARGEWNSPRFCKEYEAVPGESYVISLWLKNNESEFYIKIGGVSAFDGKYETIVKSSEKIDSWKYYEYKYTMPTEEKFDRLRFAINILSKGSFWIDDITIIGNDGNSVIPTSR